MNIKAIALSCGVAVMAMSGSAALAGGPTVPNAPSTPSVASVNAALSAAGSVLTVTAIVNNGNGTFSITTRSGATFTVSSSFVSTVLSIYG